MPRSWAPVGVVALIIGFCTGCERPSHSSAASPTIAAAVNAERITNADREPGNWMTHDRTYSEQRYSPLKEINDQNAGQLPRPSTASASEIHAGEALFQQYCAACHGDVAVSGGVLPDLRYSSTLANDQWFEIVLGGMLRTNGMISFKQELSPEDAKSVRSYVIFRAHQSLTETKSAGKK